MSINVCDVNFYSANFTKMHTFFFLQNEPVYKKQNKFKESAPNDVLFNQWGCQVDDENFELSSACFGRNFLNFSTN